MGFNPNHQWGLTLPCIFAPAAHAWRKLPCRLVDPARHPLFAEAGIYGDQERKLYADYLQVPYQEDIVLFRNKVRQIGDENFQSNPVSIGGRV